MIGMDDGVGCFWYDLVMHRYVSSFAVVSFFFFKQKTAYEIGQ